MKFIGIPAETLITKNEEIMELINQSVLEIAVTQLKRIMDRKSIKPPPLLYLSLFAIERDTKFTLELPYLLQ